MTVLVTGAAGFIGYHTAAALLKAGCIVAGIDNLNDYYDVRLKEARLALLRQHRSFFFHRVDISDAASLARVFAAHAPQQVLHLAAQAGVRYSLLNPVAYASANLSGFVNVIETCRQYSITHLVYASSSSVYGASASVPFAESDGADRPLSLYAATKRANELIAHSYHHLFGLRCTGVRLFTVYGPWGRPDMAIYSFTKALLEGAPVYLYNHGAMRRDFTYIGDIVEGLLRILNSTPVGIPAQNQILNLGGSKPVALRHLIHALEQATGRRADLRFLPMQSGDMVETCASVTALRQAIGFVPETPFEVGIEKFVAWYRGYYDWPSNAPAVDAQAPALSAEFV